MTEPADLAPTSAHEPTVPPSARRAEMGRAALRRPSDRSARQSARQSARRRTQVGTTAIAAGSFVGLAGALVAVDARTTNTPSGSAARSPSDATAAASSAATASTESSWAATAPSTAPSAAANQGTSGAS